MAWFISHYFIENVLPIPLPKSMRRVSKETSETGAGAQVKSIETSPGLGNSIDVLNLPLK